MKENLYNKSGKKKRGCCFHTCMTVLVFSFVCSCALIVLGWTVGNQYCQQTLNMSLMDTFGVYAGILNSDDDFIDNEYSASDESGFYNSIGDALLLKDGAIDGDEFKSIVVEGILESMQQPEPPTAEPAKDVSESEESDGPSGSIFLEYLLNVIKAENFNQAKINSIGTSDQANTNLKISDRELAAFINGIIDDVIINLAMEFLAASEDEQIWLDASNLNLQGCFKVNQIKFFVQDKEVDGANTSVDMARITVSLGIDDIIDGFKNAIDTDGLMQYIPQIKDFDWLADAVVNAAFNTIDLILPSKMYLTLDMGLSHSVKPDIYINNMGMGNDKMENLANMLKELGIDLDEMLESLFVGSDSAIASMLNSINDVVPLGDIISEGEIDCDVYQLIIDLARLNYEQTEDGEELKPQDEQISSDDILKTLQIVLYDNTQYLDDLKDSEYSYKNVSFKKDKYGRLDLSSGEPIIENQGAQYYVTTGEELENLIKDYEQLLLSRMSKGYGLKDSYDLDDIIEIFSGESFSADLALQMFDANKIKQIIMGQAQGVAITDKMVAALLANMLPDIFASMADPGFDASSVGIEYIYLEEKDLSVKHHVLNVGINIDIHALIESFNSDEIVNKLLKNILGKTVIVEACVDITLGLSQGEYLTTELAFNGKSLAAIDKLLTSFKVFGTDEDDNVISLGGFIDEMLLPIREVISNMGSILVGLKLEESAIKLPDVYVAIAKMFNGEKQEGDEGYVAPDTLQSALRLFVSDGPIADSSSEYYFYREENIVNVAEYNASNESALLNELGDKYGLSFNIAGREYSLAEVLYVLGVGSLEDTSAVEGKELYDFISAEQLKEIVKAEGDWKNSLKVNITNNIRTENPTESDMLTALVKKAVFNGSVDFSMLGDSFGEDDLLFVQLSEEGEKQYLTITIKVVIKEMLPSLGDEALDEFIGDLLPTTAAVFSLKVDITDSAQHEECVVTINANEQSSEAVFDLLDSFGADLDLNSVGDGVRSAFDGIKDVIGIELENGELRLPNVFAIIDELLLDNLYGDEGESIKTALELIVSDGPIADSSSDYYFYREGNESAIAEYNASNESALLNELGEKYGLTYTIGGREYSLAEVLYVLGIGSLEDTGAVEGKELYDFISAEQLKEIVLTEGNWQSSLKVNVTNVLREENPAESDMLTALVKRAVFNGSVDFSMLGDSFSEEDLLFVKLSEQGGKQYLSITIKVVIGDLIPSFDGEEGLQNLINSLLPATETVISLKVDITEGAQHEESDVEINLDGEGTDAMLDFIDKLGAELDLSVIGDSVRSAFDGIKDVIDVEIGSGELKLPNVFAVIDEMLLDNLYGDGGVSIKTALKFIVKDGPIADSSSAYYFYREGNESAIAEYNASNESELLNEFNAKYAFNYTVGGREYSLAEILYVLGIGSLEDTSAVEGKELYDFIDANRLEELAFTDGNWQSALKADITNVTRVENYAESDMLTELIKTVVFNGSIDFSMLGSGFGEEDLLFVKLSEQGGRQYLTMTVKVVIGDLIPSFDGEEGLQNLINSLLPATETVISLKVDITEGAQHEESDVEINLDGEGTDAMLDFIDKLGESIDLSAIGDSVRTAFVEFRDIIDVELGDSEMLLPNVFDIINKILLEQMYDDGTEIKAVLRSIYLTSDTVLVGQSLTRKQIYENALDGTRPKANYSDFLTDLKEKYFITGDAASATSFVQLYSYIDVENFRATNINVKGVDGLAHTTKTIQEITPKIGLGDLGAIFVANVSEFEDGVNIYSLNIEHPNLILNASVPIGMAIGDSDGLSKLITVQEIYVHVVVNADPSNVLTKDGEKYYHCEMIINSMDSEQETLFEIAEFFTGTKQDLTDIEFELGKVIYDAISILDNSYGEGNYDIHDDGIVLRDIFTFLKMNIIGDNDEISAEYVKEAIQGMYARVDGIANDNNYLVSDIVSNEISSASSALTQEQLVTSLVMGGNVLDKDVGAYVANNLDADVGDVVQLNIMAPNPTPSSRQSADRTKYTNIIGSELDGDETYIAMTVIMELSKFGGEEDDEMHGNSFVLLDDEMYITFIFEFIDGEFIYVDFAVNNMDKMHTDTLFALTGLNIDDAISNIISESSDCLAPINNLFTSLDVAAALLGRTVEHTFGEADLIDETAHGTYSCIV